jgi:hypothetical protein
MKQSLRLLAENKDKGYVDDLIREGRTQMVLPKEKCFLLSPREGEDSKRREKNHGRRKATFKPRDFSNKSKNACFFRLALLLR